MDIDGVPTTAGTNKLPLHPESIALLRRRKELGLPLCYQQTPSEARETQKIHFREFQGKCDFKGRIMDETVPSEDVPGTCVFCSYAKFNLGIEHLISGGGGLVLCTKP